MLGPAGDLLGRGFAYLELGGNLYRMGDAALHGDGGQVVMNGVGAGLTIWGMSNPYVAAGYTAWNGGWAIGEGIANIPAVETFMVDDSFNNHLMDEYGSTELTSAQAAEASQRYDGVGGFINYGHDVLENAGEKLNPMNWFD